MRIPSIRERCALAFDEGREFDPGDMPAVADVERAHRLRYPPSEDELIERLLATAPGVPDPFPLRRERA